MRIGDHISWIPFVAGSVATALKAGWLAGLVVLVVATLLTWIINDIRRAGGLALWAIKLVSVADAWDEYKTRHAKRRGKRKEEALRRARRVAELKRGTGEET